MRITDLLKKSGIALGVKVADKSEAIDKLVSLHEKCGNLKDVKPTKRESSNVKNSAQRRRYGGCNSPCQERSCKSSRPHGYHSSRRC